MYPVDGTSIRIVAGTLLFPKQTLRTTRHSRLRRSRPHLTHRKGAPRPRVR